MTELRPLNAPRPIEVVADGRGEPATVAIDGRRLAVVAVQDRWRVDDLWWRRPLSRLYFEVVLEDGRLLTLYHDLAEGGWATQRYR